MKFKIISCVNKKLAIGLNGNLLYNIKADMRNFKTLTLDNVIIMGRKTYESLPYKPLPYRINIVITNDTNYQITNGYVVHSIDECIQLCEEKFNHLECYVIGGAAIYEEFMKRNIVDYVYLTEVIDNQEGDAYFPALIYHDTWRKVFQTPIIQSKDNNNILMYTFNIYRFLDNN